MKEIEDEESAKKGSKLGSAYGNQTDGSHMLGYKPTNGDKNEPFRSETFQSVTRKTNDFVVTMPNGLSSELKLTDGGNHFPFI